jgi:hypothetical protein
LVSEENIWTAENEMVGDWRKHNEELHGLYSSPNTIRMIKLRRIRLARHVARMGIGFWWESQNERDHQEDIDVGGRIFKKVLGRTDPLLTCDTT